MLIEPVRLEHAPWPGGTKIVPPKAAEHAPEPSAKVGDLAADKSGDVKRVALAFYGLTRSLEYTVDSIKQNVMAPLTAAGIEYDVYLHTYDLQVIDNERSGEQAQHLNTTEWQLLQPDFVTISSQV
jgi:hypothetical protein